MISSQGVSVVLGTLNEGENIGRLIEGFDDVVINGGVSEILELVFVDDGSSDNTIEILEKEKMKNHPFGMKIIKRSCKQGTLNAQIVGAREASGEYILIMDSDLQHPIAAVKEMVHSAKRGSELVVASRYTRGGKNIWNPRRGIISRGAVSLAHIFLPKTRSVKDPISGYFLCKRQYIASLRPYKDRYKILLYLLSQYDLKPDEIPITFVVRKYGKSKVVGKKLDFILRYFIELVTYMRESSNVITNNGDHGKKIEAVIETNK